MDTLEALTARPVTLSYRDPRTTVRSEFLTVPAGTSVYVGRVRGGQAEIRLPGTLYGQTVLLSAIQVP